MLAILEVRNIADSGDVRETITSCADTEQLEAWVRRAAVAETIEDVLG